MVMHTNILSPNDPDDDFELPTLPRFVDYDEFVAQWEEEGRQYRCHILKQSAKHTAKSISFDLEFDQWLVDDLRWARAIQWHHKQWQEFQIASPLDGKVRLQTETAARWVMRDAYAQDPHQWDSNGQVWVRAAVGL